MFYSLLVALRNVWGGICVYVGVSFARFSLRETRMKAIAPPFLPDAYRQ